MQGYIKLHRSLLDWEWYDDIPTTRLLIHLLLTVNLKPDCWHGIDVPAGARVCSIATLSKELHLSNRQIRTAIEHLEATGSVTRVKYPKCTVLAVACWDKYQNGRQANRQAGGTQDDEQATRNRQQNKNIRKKEERRNPLTPFLEQTDGPARFRKAYITDPETGERRVRILDDLD